MTNETLTLPPIELTEADLAVRYMIEEDREFLPAVLHCRERQFSASLVENERLRAKVEDIELSLRTSKFQEDSYLEEHSSYGRCTNLIRAEAAEVELAGERQENDHLTNVAIDLDYLRQNAEASEAKLLGALKELIAACDGNYKELVEECEAAIQSAEARIGENHV